MAGDITRSTFEAKKHYSGVRMQQGRVQMDADWNEQLDIRTHVERTTNLDVIGPCGAPEPATANFAVQVAGGNLLVKAGRIYVDGILCENEQDVLLANPASGATPGQPDLPKIDCSAAGALSFEPLLAKLGVPAGFAPLPPTPGIYSAYLDVWERDIIALDDSSIREVALGGPDTATRKKVVWQAKLLRIGDANAPENCPTDWSALASTGTLAAQGQPDPGNNNPCVVPAQAGYRRLENQLYRVEVHTPGDAKTATFKWSRDNASVVAGWTSQDPADPANLIVTTLGKDTELGFSGGQWVELTDDTRELWGIPGTLVQLKTAQATGQGPTLTIDATTASPAGPIDIKDFPLNPKVRRWDQAATATVKLTGGALAVKENAWLDLEDGVQVFFASGGKYNTGDHWLIPARTATAISNPAVEWPTDATNTPLQLPAAGIRHHYCALALVRFNSGNTWTFLKDCRAVFPPLTGLPTSGEGCCCTVTVSPSDLTGNKTLQSMIDSVAGQPATVSLLPGKYLLHAPLVLTFNHSRMTIEGCSEGVILQAAAGSENAFVNGLVVLSEASQVTLRGLTFAMPSVPFVGGGGKLAALDPAAIAGAGGPGVLTLQKLLTSVAIRPVACGNLTIEDCTFAFNPTSTATVAMIFTAADAGSAGNNIVVSINVHQGADLAHSTYDVTVTETDTYTNLNMSTIESVLGSDTVKGSSPGLVRVQHQGLTQALPPSGTFQLTGGAANAPASVKISQPGTTLALTLLAKKNGVDGARTSVQIVTSPAGGSFNLTATWTKTVLGVTVANTQAALAALNYEVTVAPPAGGSFALPGVTPNQPIRLVGGSDATGTRAAGKVPAVQPNLFQVGILAGGDSTGLEVRNNTFASPTSFAVFERRFSPTEVTAEPFSVSIGYLLLPAATIAGITTLVTGAAKVTVLNGPKWLSSSLTQAAFTGNTFTAISAAAIVSAESGAVRIEDNDVQNCYAGFLIFARRSAAVVTGQMDNIVGPLQDILHDGLLQLAGAIGTGYPLPAAFDASNLTALPAANVVLNTNVFPNQPLLSAFNVLLQMFSTLQAEAVKVISPRGLTLALQCTGNAIDASSQDATQNSTGAGLVVWGENQGKAILSANRIENATPPFEPTVTVVAIDWATINGNLIFNHGPNSTSNALIQSTTAAATGNVIAGNTNIGSPWDGFNVEVTAG